MEPVYRLDGDTLITSGHAAGPWDPTMQHGSPPSAAVAWAAERIPTRTPMNIARLTIDLMRPVPVAPLAVETEVLREGRKIQLCAVRLKAGGVVVVNATVLKVKLDAAPLPDDVPHPALDVPPPEQGRPVNMTAFANPFGACMTVRDVQGGFNAPGPAAVWYRLDRPMVGGYETTPAMRAAVASAFSNATSAVIDFRRWMFMNADLSINLARPPVGEWILLNSEMWLGGAGAGIARSRLADRQGYFGHAVQSLVIEPR